MVESGKMKKTVYLFLVIFFGCSTGPVSPGMTFLQSLNYYRAEIGRLQNKPERWPERQAMGESLKNQHRVIIGPSAEFDWLVDLDSKRRELVIALSDPSLRPERAAEIKQELAQIEKDITALTGPIKAQLANAEVRTQQQPQRTEAAATIGLVSLAVDAFASPEAAGRANPPSITVGGQYTVTDYGYFAAVKTPEGPTVRCAPVLVGEAAAAMKCEQPGK